jgi:trimeric autotransporter adhesin
MKRFLYSPSVLAAILLLCSLLSAQQAAVSTSAAAVVPRLVNFSGKAIDQGKTVTGVTGITFAIYSEETGGSPLWLETQNIQPDNRGNYTAQLGATKSEGLPLDLFTSGEARWLGARVNGGEEQPRVLLLSVPYALKASDAQTLAGLPASAFVLAGTVVAGNSPSAEMSAAQAAMAPVSGTGTTDFLPLWTNSTGALGNSVLFQSGTGTSAKIGINTAAPGATLDVNGGENVHGILNLLTTGTATASAGKNSQPQDFTASVFNSSTATAVAQKFQWQAEPVSNNTASASGAMSLLYATGSGAVAETGLKINSKGQLTFAAGQAFPGTGKGSVTSIGLSAPSTDFSVSGSPVTTSGTLALNWNTAPTSADTANAIVKRDSTGSFSAGSITSASPTSSGTAIYGVTSGDGYGIIGQSSSGFGIYGESSSFPGVGGISDTNYAVYGVSESSHGVVGSTLSASAYGVYGTNSETGGVGVYGLASTGVVGVSNTGGPGVYAQSGDNGWAVDAYNTGDSTGILAGSVSGFAGWFNGDVEVDGNLSKAAGSFKIDHPLDPANKYLYHSFVESPDMMNIYNGNVITNATGDAVVTLPEWFETLNRDFRYQLTVVGQFAQAIVGGEVSNHQFAIKTDKPNVKVSWQITGIRQDAWANAHRIPVEEVKPEVERGFYQHPELYNAPAEKSILWARYPQAMKQWKTARTAKLAPPVRSPLVKASVPAKP